MRLDEGQGPEFGMSKILSSVAAQKIRIAISKRFATRKATDTPTPTDRFRRCEKLPDPRSPTIEGCWLLRRLPF